MYTISVRTSAENCPGGHGAHLSRTVLRNLPWSKQMASSLMVLLWSIVDFWFAIMDVLMNQLCIETKKDFALAMGDLEQLITIEHWTSKCTIANELIAMPSNTEYSNVTRPPKFRGAKKRSAISWRKLCHIFIVILIMLTTIPDLI